MASWLLSAVLLFAQVEVPSAASWSGWAAFLVNGGVLAWLLLVHLPRKDVQMKEFHDAKDRQLEAKDAKVVELTGKYEAKLNAVIASFEKESEASRKEFRAAIDVIHSHCEKEMTRLIDTFRSEIGASRGEGRRPV